MKACKLITAMLLFTLALTGCGAATGAPASPAGAPGSAAASASSQPASSSGAAAKPGPAAYKITVPYTAVSGAFAGLWVAADQGFFSKYSIQADVRSMDANVAGPALLSGEVEYAASPSLVSAILSGSDVTFIAALATHPIFAVYGAKGISRMEDLKGKVIADTIVGSAPDTSLRDLMTKHGLKEADVQFAHLPNPVAVLAAMQAGTAVAGILPPPTTLRARDAGFVELTSTLKDGLSGLSAPIVTKKGRLKDKPDEARAVLLALKDATAFMHGNADATKQIIGKYTKTDPGPDLDEVYNAFQPIWELGPVQAEDVAAVLRYLPDPRAATADPRTFFDNSLVQSL
ncbi:MAG TPA: ABC transporter substrate-binding protein [Chloroflexota bacterium]|jgi:NitT/TauT family transport system substrate-binding protein